MLFFCVLQKDNSQNSDKNSMVSHKSLGGLDLSIGKGGLRFKKRSSGYNICIGKKLKGGKGPTEGGRYDTAWQAEFTSAAKTCARGRVGKVV
jgi:hypothetical protein